MILEINNEAFVLMSIYRFLPIMDRIFAKKGDGEGHPKVRLITIWLGKLLPVSSIRLLVPNSGHGGLVVSC